MSDIEDLISDYKKLENNAKKTVYKYIESEFRCSRSWFTGRCKYCGFNIVVMPSPCDDYWWYCSNKQCEYHSPGEHTGALENPEFYTTN